MNYAPSAAIGAVAGLRSMAAPAIVSQAAAHKLVDVRMTPLSWLSSPRNANVLTVLALGELVGDKLPFAPDRTGAPLLIARFVTGALCGAALAPSRKWKDRLAGALIGGTVAVGAAFLGLQYRRRASLPKFAAALMEDTAAIVTGTAAVAAYV